MLDIDTSAPGRVQLSGWFDATQVERAEEAFGDIKTSHVIDLAGLEYISSAGLGFLLRVQKQLSATGDGLTLTHLTPHVENIFVCAGFDHVFTIE